MPRSKARQRIAVDMDEVVADTLSEHLRRYNEAHDDRITKDDLHGKWLWDVVQQDRLGSLEKMLRSVDFFADLDVMPESQRVLERLQERYEIFIASAAMEVPTSFVAKFKWMERHFPFIPASNIVFCGDKSIVRADYLIDDNPRQFQDFGGEGILYSSPHNKFVTGYRRVNDWLEVEAMFLP